MIAFVYLYLYSHMHVLCLENLPWQFVASSFKLFIRQDDSQRTRVCSYFILLYNSEEVCSVHPFKHWEVSMLFTNSHVQLTNIRGF